MGMLISRHKNRHEVAFVGPVNEPVEAPVAEPEPEPVDTKKKKTKAE